MVRRAVTSEDAPSLKIEVQLNVDPEQVHVVLTTLELDIIVDALRSVGNVEITERLEAILRLVAQASRPVPDS